MEITAANVRQFLVTRYFEPLERLGLIPGDLSDDFDFLLNGVIDSFGILEMISAIEDEFQIRLGGAGCGKNHDYWPAVMLCRRKSKKAVTVLTTAR